MAIYNRSALILQTRAARTFRLAELPPRFDARLTMKARFTELEYAVRNQRTRRDIFLDERERLVPWAALEQADCPLHTALMYLTF